MPSLAVAVIVPLLLTGSSSSAASSHADASLIECAPVQCRFEPDAPQPTALRLAVFDDAEPEPIEPALPTRFGERGSARIDFHVGYGIEAKDSDNRVVLAGLGYSYFIRTDFAIVLELNGLYIDQVGPNAAGFNFNLLLRYHFINEDTWSVFFDGGAGMLFTDEEVPDRAGTFNFTPQIGIGFTCDIGSNNRLMAGVRWLHISNANTDPFNPGRDHAYAYAGLSLPF